MIHNLKPYPAYKPSGVPSLGAVPAHWEVLALKRLGWFKSGTGFPIEEQGQQDLEIPFFKVSDMNLPGNDLVMEIWNNAVSHSTAARLGATVFPPGTIIFPKVGGALLTNKRRVVEHHFCMDNNIMGFVVKHGNPDFLLLLLQNLDLATIAKPGPVPAISEGEIREIRTVLPSLPEQTAIVRFLDHADRRIQRYLRAKQKLIALLEEQKQAIIHQAVTGQIDVRTGQPYPAYKPSGVEWLGDVPAHWEVIRLKFVAAELVDCLHETPKYSENGEFPAIRTADISPGILHLSSARRIEADEYARWIERLEPKPGDILYSREGERFGIAACVPDGVRLCISQRMMVFRIRPEHNPVFVMWLLNSKQVYAQACQDIMGATAPHVNVSTIRNYFLALPARDEQDSLVDKIENSTKGFSSAISNTEGEISFLREYRTRLLADVVTGKLDVREAAAALPEVDPLATEDTLNDSLNPDAGSALDKLDAVPEEAEA